MLCFQEHPLEFRVIIEFISKLISDFKYRNSSKISTISGQLQLKDYFNIFPHFSFFFSSFGCNSSLNCYDVASILFLLQLIKTTPLFENSRRAEELERLKACEGGYAEKYDTLTFIGKGAFGFVWAAKCKMNQKEVKKLFT